VKKKVSFSDLGAFPPYGGIKKTYVALYNCMFRGMILHSAGRLPVRNGLCLAK
jgi:hypothetical protein